MGRGRSIEADCASGPATLSVVLIAYDRKLLATATRPHEQVKAMLTLSTEATGQISWAQLDINATFGFTCRQTIDPAYRYFEFLQLWGPGTL